jgi:hypothetical protein
MSDLVNGEKFRYNAFSFNGPGGEQFEEERYKAEALRADLIELASQVSISHGVRVVDSILSKFDVSRKF